jgi:hypothetical protein
MHHQSNQLTLVFYQPRGRALHFLVSADRVLSLPDRLLRAPHSHMRPAFASGGKCGLRGDTWGGTLYTATPPSLRAVAL